MSLPLLLSNQKIELAPWIASDYLPAMDTKVEQNEREQYSPLHGFSDEQVIYYWVHRKTHSEDRYQKKDTTKQEYLRDILQFYSTLKQWESFLREDTPNFVETSLIKNIQKRHLRHYQEYLKTARRADGKMGYSLSSRSRKINTLKSFLAWLYQNRYIEVEVHTAFLNNELRMEDRPNRELSYQEVKQILDFYQAHPINYAILSVLFTTGLRVAEIAKAKWKDIYYDYATGRYYLKVSGKRDKVRHALLFTNVFERIQVFRRQRGLNDRLDPNDDSPMFITNKGKAYTYKYLSNQITAMIMNTKLPFLAYKDSRVSPHWARHFFAEFSHIQKVPITTIQRTLGHSDIRTTQIYLANRLKKEEDAALQWEQNKF